MRLPALLVLALAAASCARRDPPAPLDPAVAAADEAHGDDHIEAANVVEMSLEAQRRAGIEVLPARAGKVQVLIKATGTVQPMDSRIAQLRPLARGRILQVLAKTGDRVARDQVLARFDNIEAGELASQAAAARAEIQRSRIQLTAARRQQERARGLLAIGAVPAREFEAAEAAANEIEAGLRAQQSSLAGLETRLRRFGPASGGDPAATEIRAPVAGVVVSAAAAPGDVIDAATTLFSIADLSRVYVEARVYEKDLGKVRIDQPVLISVDAYPREVFHGRTAAIKDILDPVTRTAVVRCELPNPAGRLKLEMFANLTIPAMDAHHALAVPAAAVQTVNRRQVVFVRKAALHFEVRPVQALGSGPLLEIAAGLNEGEMVVTKGAFQLKSAFLAKELDSEHAHD